MKINLTTIEIFIFYTNIPSKAYSGMRSSTQSPVCTYISHQLALLHLPLPQALLHPFIRRESEKKRGENKERETQRDRDREKDRGKRIREIYICSGKICSMIGDAPLPSTKLTLIIV